MIEVAFGSTCIPIHHLDLANRSYSIPPIICTMVGSAFISIIWQGCITICGKRMVIKEEDAPKAKEKESDKTGYIDLTFIGSVIESIVSLLK